jgi:hypothetical protein
MHGLILLPALIIGVTVASACLAQTPMPVQAQPLATGQPQVQLQAPIQLAGITPDQPQQAADPAPAPDQSFLASYFENYFPRVEAAQASQPHWMTPLVTVTPRLEQEVRYDQYWESRGNGSTLDIFDAGKGLELIPTDTNELLINPPAYQFKGRTAKPANGWLDDQFLVIKQRLLSGNEENGDYVVSAFLGVTAPSGDSAFTNHAWVITPTLAAGMGFGDFDVQGTVGVAIPTRDQSTLGVSVASNIAFQYHIGQYFWPEFEINDTYWADGKERGGKDQVLLTPGIILGRFVIYKRVKFIIGGGRQWAVAPKYANTGEQTPTYNRSWILTARVTF